MRDCFKLCLPSPIEVEERTGCPSEIFLPRGWLPDYPEDLVGAPLWIYQRNKLEAGLWGCVTLSSLDEIAGQTGRNDCIGTVDLSRSFGVHSTLPSSWTLPSNDAVVVPCSPEEHRAALDVAFRSSPLRFVAPEIMHPSPRGAKATLSARAKYLSARTSHVCRLPALGRWHKTSALSGIGAAVCFQLLQEFPEVDLPIASEAAARCDPLLLIESLSNPYKDHCVAPALPEVDMMFVDIDPQCLVARTFMCGQISNGIDAARRTEAAEQSHQAILRFLAQGLMSLGIRAQQSGSIDLLAFSSERPQIFEVKSAHSANAYAQFSKGVLQLHRYSLAFQDAYGDEPQRWLLLEQYPGYENHREHFQRLGKAMNIEVCFCNVAAGWPQGALEVSERFRFCG